MTVLKDLLALRQEPIAEEHPIMEDGPGVEKALDNWMDSENVHSWEGATGVRNFTKLARALNYDDIDDFLGDNSGALQAMLQWIIDTDLPEWKEALEDGINGGGGQ